MAAEAVERLARRLSLVGGTPELPEDWQHGNPIASFLETLEGAVEERLNRMEELERTCGEARLRQVNLEQMLKNTQHKRAEEQAELNRLKATFEESTSRLALLEEENNKRINDKSLIQADFEKASGEIELLRARCERMEAEKTDLLRLVERRQVDTDGLNEQIETLTGRMRTLREDALRHDSEVTEAKSKATTAQRHLELAKEGSEQYRQQAEWTSSELERHIEEFGSYRRNKSAELASLQAQLEGIQEVKMQMEEQLRTIRASLHERDSKVEELLRRTRDAEETLADREAMFLQEMNAKSRLADLYKEGMEETTIRLEEAEALLQMTHSGNVEERIRQACHEKEVEIGSLQGQLTEKEHEITLLRKHLDEFGGSGGHIVPDSTKGGKTLSEVYSEYATAKTDLLKAQQEIERLKGCIQDICQDIEARVPVLQQERRENERLKIDVSSLSQQLVEVSRLKDDQERRLRNKEEELIETKRDRNLLDQQVKDLGKQVQALLGKMEGIEGESIPPSSGLDKVVDAEHVIDERLVVFRNIQELQVRNQELVRVIRELSQQQETVEIERLKKAEQEMRVMLDQNASELSELRETRQRQMTLVESLIRQRDMLREMISNQQSHPHTMSSSTILSPTKGDDELSELKAEFDMFKAEKGESERYLMTQLEQCRNEKAEINGRVAQLTAQLDFSHERYNLLKQNYEMERSELEGLRKSNNSALSSIMQHQSHVQQLMGEMMSAKDTQQRLSSQLSSLRVELDMTKTSERRLTGELAVVQQEKERLSQLLSGLQAMASEQEGAEGQLKRRLGEQLEFLERELQSSRHKIVEEVEAHKLAIAVADREYRDLVRRHDQLMEGASKSKEEANQAKGQVSELTRRVHDLEILHRRSEERLSQLMVPITGQAESDLPRELAAMRAKLGAVEDELRLEREHIISYKEMAKNAEASLSDLNGTFDQYKETSERRLSELNNQIEQLTGQLEAAERTRTSVEEELTRTINSLNSERTQLVQQLGELREYEAMAKSHSSLRKEDVDRLQQLLAEAQTRYEQEVVAHGRDLEVLTNLKGEVQGYQRQMSELSSMVGTLRDQLALGERTLQGEREQWNAERIDGQRRISELESQNNILLGQIETMAGRSSRRVSDIPSTGGDGEEGSGGNVGDSGDLMEVVRYLRRQKDILQTEHDSMSIEYRRIKAQAEQLQRSLDETRAMLAEERQGSQWQEQMATEYRALLEKVSQMNILRESNVTLRQEADHLSRQVHALQEQLLHSQEQIVPKEEECRLLGAKLSAMGEEMRVLRDDRDNWKKRFDQLLVKYRVDPAEMERQNEQLRETLESANVQISNLHVELEQLRGKMSDIEGDASRVPGLERELEEKTGTLETLNNKWTQLETKHKGLLQTSRNIVKARDDLAKRVAELESTGNVPSDQLNNLQAEKERLDGELVSVRQELQEKSTKLDKFAEAFKKMAKLKEQHKETQDQLKDLQEQLKGSEQRVEEVKREAELRNNLLNANWQSKVKKLTTELEQLKGDTGGGEQQPGERSPLPKEKTPEPTDVIIVPSKRAKVETTQGEDYDEYFAEEEDGSGEEGVVVEEVGEDEVDEETTPMTTNPEPTDAPNNTESTIPAVIDQPQPPASADMLGFSDLEDEIMEGISDGGEEPTLPATTTTTTATATQQVESKSRVIDLSEIGKRPVMRPMMPVRGTQQTTLSRGGAMRGRGQLTLRRARRGGGLPHHGQPGS